MKGMQKISRGSGFQGVLRYALEGKDQGPGHGRLLGGSMAGTTARELAAEFRAIARMRPDIARPVWHNSLRMPAGEDISDARWNAIATSYLKRMRFDLKHTQYAVFKHDDAHVHLVVNRVMTDGSVFLGRNENLLSTQVIQRLERAFKLTLTPGPSYTPEGKIVMPAKSGLKKAEIEMALRLQTQPARQVLQDLVAGALKGRPTTGEFLARLDALGVQAVPNIASTGRMNGFSFEWDGIAFTGSQLGAAYKWAAIQQAIVYDQVADSEELARRQAEARHRRADGAAEKPADHAGQPVEHGGGEGPLGAADDSVPAGQRGAVDSAGEPGGPERAQTLRILEELGQVAVAHDEALKVTAWRQQAAALGAPVYRLTLTDGLRPLEKARPVHFGQGMADEGAKNYSAGQIEDLIPELRVLNVKGFDVSFTPLDPAHHYLVAQGLTPQRLDGLRADGYVPALVQQSGEADLWAVLKAPRESARDDEQSLLDAVSLELNQRWGQQRSKDGGQDLPMAGFIRHVDHAPAKKSALTVILEALGAFCEKTLARFKALRRVSDEQAEKAALRRQGELKRGQAAAKFITETEAKVYRRHAAQSRGQTPDQVDLAVAKEMLRKRQTPGQVKAALRTSPALAKRHPDVERYVKEVAKNARKALDAPAP